METVSHIIPGLDETFNHRHKNDVPMQAYPETSLHFAGTTEAFLVPKPISRQNMKLVRFGAFGSERPGVLNRDGNRIDLSQYFTDWNSEFFANDGLDRLSRILQAESTELPPVSDEVRWGA